LPVPQKIVDLSDADEHQIVPQKKAKMTPTVQQKKPKTKASNKSKMKKICDENDDPNKLFDIVSESNNEDPNRCDEMDTNEAGGLNQADEIESDEIAVIGKVSLSCYSSGYNILLTAYRTLKSICQQNAPWTIVITNSQLIQANRCVGWSVTTTKSLRRHIIPCLHLCFDRQLQSVRKSNIS